MLDSCQLVSDGSRKGCSKKCTAFLTNNRRQEIHDHYWSLTKDQQSIWISHSVETIEPVRPRKKTSGKKERKHTRIFHLEDEGGVRRTVCQKMFLSTLGLTTDRSIQTVLSKCESTRTTSDLSDKRGKHTPANKKSDNLVDKVNQHILSYNPSITHYRRKHAPNRLYISPEFNVSMMYRDFCESNPDEKVSY